MAMKFRLIILAVLFSLLMMPAPGRCASEGPMLPPEDSADSRAPVVEVGYSYERLNNGYADWREYYIAAKKRVGDRSVVYGAYRSLDRFSLQDQEVLVGTYFPLDRHWTANVEASTSTNHAFLPEWSAWGGLHLKMGGGWGAEAGYRYRKYTDKVVTSEKLTVEKYFGSFRAAYAVTLGQPQGLDNTTSHAFRLTHYYGSRNSVTLDYSFGREIESLGPDRFIIMDTNGLNLWGSHWMGRSWGVFYAAGIHEQRPLYTRNKLQLGVFYQF